ncbi:MAG: hypothetical protein J5892_04350 [Bacilli bacterium]|nr:hypothetical protein [Bacilli bacterium]
MEMFYKRDTLFVNINNDDHFKGKIFNVLDDYDIENIVINIIGTLDDSKELDDFINEYHDKYSGHLTVR